MSASSDTRGFSSVLPMELWQEVIDVIAAMEEEQRPSSGSLHACALTCKAWSRLARPHLHKTISIRSVRHAERFLRAISSSLCNLGSMASYVNALEIHDTREKPYIRKMLPDFARALPNLRVLSLSNMDSTTTRPTAQLPLFREVTQLTVQRGRFTDSRDLIGLISSLPQLQSLQLLSVAFALGRPLEPPHYHPVPVHLRAVDVDVLESFTDVMRWLMNCPRLHITELTLPMPDTADAYPLVGEFLRHIRLVQNLCLQWQIPTTKGFKLLKESVRDNIDLSVNTALRYVHFDLICFIPALGVNFSWMPILIRQLANAPALEGIRTSIVFKQSVSNLEGFPWQDIENAAVELKLRSVSWSFLVKLPLQAEAEKFVRKKMPRLQSQGVLNFIEI